MFHIASSEGPPPFPENDMSEDAREFLRLCLQRNPKLRADAKSLLSLSFCSAEDVMGTTPPASSPYSSLLEDQKGKLLSVLYSAEDDGKENKRLNFESGSSDEARANKSSSDEDRPLSVEDVIVTDPLIQSKQQQWEAELQNELEIQRSEQRRNSGALPLV